MQIYSKRTVRQMEEFAIFVKLVNFGCHNNYFRPGPRLLYATCSFKKPLQQPYDGPYKVLQREAKYYTVDINGRKDTVSLDRLKPAYFEQTSPETSSSTHAAPTAQATLSPPSTPTGGRVTRSGRRVHWPQHLVDYVHSSSLEGE